MTEESHARVAPAQYEDGVPELHRQLLDKVRSGSTTGIQDLVGFLLFEQNPISTDQAISVFKIMDRNGNGELTVDEIIAEVREPDVYDFIIAQGESPLIGLLLEKNDLFYFFTDTRGIQISALDMNMDGKVSIDEWLAVVDTLIRQHLEYIRILSYLKKRCFWGRGITAASEIDFYGIDKLLGISDALMSSWLEDFLHYQRNNHPLFGIFYHEANSLL